MISSIKKRLTMVFTTTIVGVNILGMVIVYVFIHLSMDDAYKKHIAWDIEKEFIPNYRQGGLNKISELYEEGYFQVLDRNGDILGGSVNSSRFRAAVDRELLAKASSGDPVFTTLEIEANRYLVSYFFLDENHVGRIALSLNDAVAYQRRFLKLVVIGIPAMLALSYALGRLLVAHAMKPTIDAYEFREIFLSNITHELRSPLASIRGNLEVALRKDRTPEEYREVMHLSLQETDRVIDLLKNLNLLASAETEPLKLFDEQIDLMMVVSDVAKAHIPALDSRGITLNCAEFSSFTCLCDESLMKRAIENLLDNAVKYTPDGGEIKVSSFKDSRTTYLTISNTASDITKDEIKYLFEPFYRGRGLSTRGREGQGLGLFIARYIIRSHHGDIRIRITDDQVFSVTVSLPHR